MYPGNQQVAYPQVVVYPQSLTQKYVQPILSTEVPIKETKKRKYDLATKFPQGISLSWSVDAYYEKSVGIIEKLKNCFGKKSKESPVIYDSRLDPYQQRQPIQEPETTNVKQILRKGMLLIKNFNTISIYIIKSEWNCWTWSTLCNYGCKWCWKNNSIKYIEFSK
jgi:hypothetical protein